MTHLSVLFFKYLFYSIRESQSLMFTNYEKQTTTELMHKKFYSTCTLPKPSFITFLPKYIHDGGSELLRKFSKYFANKWYHILEDFNLYQHRH